MSDLTLDERQQLQVFIDDRTGPDVRTIGRFKSLNRSEAARILGGRHRNYSEKWAKVRAALSETGER